MRASLFFLPSLALLLPAIASSACSSAGSNSNAHPRLAAAAPAEPVEVQPTEGVARGSVDRALKAGLGRFLGYLDVEAALDGGGKFVGWRILELRGAGWAGVDLKVGDVVTSVNGFPLERDRDADAAFQSLAVASEIRVARIRDGQRGELRLSILDDDAIDTATAPPIAANGAPPAPPATTSPEVAKPPATASATVTATAATIPPQKKASSTK